MGGLLLFFTVERDSTCVLTLFEGFLISLKDRHHHLGILVARGSDLLLFGELALDGLEVFQLQLGINDTLVLHGINGGATLTDDIVIVETTDDMDDGIALTDIAKELITKALTFTGTLDEAGDIHDLTGSGDDTSGMNNLRKFRQSLIGDRNDAEGRLNRTEREVGCLCLRTRQTVEKCRLTHIRQAYNTTF